MTNEEILKAVNYLKPLEPTKDVIINFMELARKDERDKVINEIENFIDPFYFRATNLGEHHPHKDLLTKLNELRKEGIV